MDTLYNRNGLIFWTQREIQLRNSLVEYFVSELGAALKVENRAFEMIQVEAPILTPKEFINPNYTTEDFYTVPTCVNSDYDLVLRPETTMGSYQYAKWLLEHTETKTRLPICIWQHGKSFRKEQDQVTKNMRLKEFYQLEFQCIYSNNTANDYSLKIIPEVRRFMSDLIGPCRIEESDRLPNYSEKTMDIVCEKTNMEVASISLRKDFLYQNGASAKVLEVAIGSDRCVYNFLEKTNG